MVPLPAVPAESSKLQTSSCPFLSPKVDRTSEIARGPMSPFFGSTVEPISTSFVSFFRIEVVSFGTMEPAPAGDPEELCAYSGSEPWCFPHTPKLQKVLPRSAEARDC